MYLHDGEAIMRLGILSLVVSCVVAACGCRGGEPPQPAQKTPPRAVEKAKPTTVVMAINLGEEDEAGGCGDVIHAVRAASKSGVRTHEIDTRNKADMEAASKKYRIVVQPTVVLLDDADNEVRRYEGESKDTIAALEADLNQMAGK